MTELHEFVGYVYGQENNQACARVLGTRMAADLLEKPERLTSEDVLPVLDKWKFAKKKTLGERTC